MNRAFLVAVAMGAVGFGTYALLQTRAGKAVSGAAHQVTGGQLEQGRQLVENARGKLGAAAIEETTRAVAMFREAHNRLPAGLQDLVDRGYLTKVPDGVAYDPVTGAVSAP